MKITSSIYKYNQLLRGVIISVFVVLQLLEMIPMISPYLKFGKNLLFLVLSVSFCLSFAESGNWQINRTDKLLFLFLIWYLFVILKNYNLNLVINLKVYLYMLMQLVIIYNFLKFPLYNKKLFERLSQLQVILYTSVISISLLMFLFKIQYSYTLNDYLYIIGTNSGRLTGLVGNSNLLAVLAVLNIILTINFIKSKYLKILISLISIYALVLCNSRSTLMAFVLILVLNFSKSWTEHLPPHSSFKRSIKFSKKHVIIIFAITIGLVTKTSSYLHRDPYVLSTHRDLPYLSGYSNNINEKNESRDESDGLRKDLLILGIQVFLDHPIVGVTAYNIGYHSQNHISNSLHVSRDNPILNNPHNILVHILASSGIVGFFLLIMFFYQLVITILTLKLKNTDTRLRAVILTSAFFLIISQFEWYVLFSTGYFATIFWLYSGIVACDFSHNDYKTL